MIKYHDWRMVGRSCGLIQKSNGDGDGRTRRGRARGVEWSGEEGTRQRQEATAVQDRLGQDRRDRSERLEGDTVDAGSSFREKRRNSVLFCPHTDCRTLFTA